MFFFSIDAFNKINCHPSPPCPYLIEIFNNKRGSRVLNVKKYLETAMPSGIA
jgi:hypothetical protein